MLKDYYFDKREHLIYTESVEHYHKGHEIYCMTEGECGYFIDDRLYDVHAGDVVFLPAGTIHRTIYPDAPHSRLLINFTSVYLPSLIEGETARMKHVYHSPKIYAKVVDALKKIEQEWAKPDCYSDDLIISLTVEIMTLLVREGVREEEEEPTLATEAVKYIRQNFAEDVRLSVVAESLNVSAEHLSRVFKQKTGFGFNEYLTLVRLQKAEEMLEYEAGLSVSEVAFACGFNDANYFSHRFKQHYGHSPKRQKADKPGVEEGKKTPLLRTGKKTMREKPEQEK